MVQPCYQCQVVGSDSFGASSFYYDLIFTGQIPLALNHYWYWGGHCASLQLYAIAKLTSSEPYMHGLITTWAYYVALWAYYGCTHVSPEVLNFLR